MAYTSKQLSMAWTAVHDGLTPDAVTLADIQNKAAQASAGAITDAQALSWVLNSADKTTALAVLSYQFFTGKSPSKAGLEYLVNSSTNPNDLNDAYYAKFGLENRYINFAANLGVQGEGKDAFAAKYGAMSFGDYIASIYESIIGSSYAKAAGLDAAKAIADISSRQAAILATAKSAGMITPNMTQAQIDMAVKAAAAGYLLGEAIKADVGLYAASANNFMLALAKGDAVYNTNITNTYKPSPGQGIGQSVPVAPAADTMPGAPPQPPPPPEPESLGFTLTAGPDTFNGASLNDSFQATHTTFDAGDKLNGGGGTDTLKLTATKGSTWTVPNATVTNFEIAQISNNAGLVVDTTGWTGLTQLTTTSVGVTTVTAATTTDVTATVTGQAANTVAVTGGHDVTVTTTGATTGQITVGGTPSGAIVISRETTGAVVAGLIGVQGGKTIDITQTATNAVNTTQTHSAIQVLGGAQTTSVKIKATPAAVADASHAGVIGGDVIIADVNYGSAAPGTITSIDIDGAKDVSISANAVNTLKVSHVTGGISIFYFGGGPPVSDTLNMTLNAVDASSFFTINLYTKLNVTTGSQASSLSTADFGNITALTIDGSSPLTVNSVNAASLQTVTTTGAGGLNANLSSLANLTAINTTASTGVSTVTIDPSKTTFAGGAGGDTVTLGGTNITKAIDLGAGDDTLVLADGMGVPGVILNGGAGTADVLSILYADAIALSGSNAFANQVTGFERLLIRNGPITTLDVTQLGDYHYFISEHGLGITLKGLVSGDTLQFKDFATATKLDAGDFGGANDTLNIVLANPGGANPNYGWLQGDVIENLAIAIIDTAATTGTHTWQARSTSVKTVTVTGNADLSLTLDSTNVTSVDASGLTGGGLSFTTSALTGAATIKGSASHDNDVTFSAATGGVITYEGGSGNDTVYGNNGLYQNVVHLGEGTNYFEGFAGGASAITAGSGDDYIKITNGAATINAGNGGNTVIALDPTASTITTGTGNDNIFVGGGANVVNVGSGTDYVGISAGTATTTDYTTINGMGAGDKIEFSNLTLSQTTAGAAVATLGSYAATLTSALAGDGSATPILKWFVFGGDTYVVVDNSVSGAFDPNVDYVVKVTGVHDLNAANNVSTFTVTLH
jgi:S-layer protein